MWQVGATLHRGARASHYRGLSCCGAQAPDVQAQQLWLTGLVAPRHVDLPRPGLEPASPALADRFSTTAPPGKPPFSLFVSVYVYVSLCDSFSIALLLPFVLGFCLSFFFFNNYFFFSFLSFFVSCFLPFLRNRVADRVLVLWPGVRPVPLRWESRVQDIGLPETSRLHIISNGKISPRDLHLNAKTQLHSMTSKLQCWTPYAKQLTRQEHNPTH